MATLATNDLDYLTARLHARRSRMAEAERLDAWCRLRTLPELGHAFYPNTEFPTASDFQRRRVEDLIQELDGCRKYLDGAGREFVDWLLARFQVENIKILLRGRLNSIPLEKLVPHLVSLPADLALNPQTLLAAETIGDFVSRLPAGKPRDRLKEMAARQPDDPPPFLLEAALDCGYLQELLARTRRLPDEEPEIIQPLIFQEVNFFHLMLVVRGKFHHGLAAEALSPLRVAGSGVSVTWFTTLLAAPDLPAVAKNSIGIAVDKLPASRGAGEAATSVDSATVEALAWQRWRRLANGAFRRSPIGLGAVAGYAALRRIETANLITLSEGIRLGLDAGKIRARLIPRTDLEVAHV